MSSNCNAKIGKRIKHFYCCIHPFDTQGNLPSFREDSENIVSISGSVRQSNEFKSLFSSAHQNYLGPRFGSGSELIPKLFDKSVQVFAVAWVESVFQKPIPNQFLTNSEPIPKKITVAIRKWIVSFSDFSSIKKGISYESV